MSEGGHNGEARELREEGIARVLGNSAPWPGLAMCAFVLWITEKPPGFEFIGEEFRAEALGRGLPSPHHPNAWGGFFSSIVKSGWVRHTGRMKPTASPASHTRRTCIYAKAN